MGGFRPARPKPGNVDPEPPDQEKAFANSGLNREWAVSGQLAKNSKCGPGAARKEVFVY